MTWRFIPPGAPNQGGAWERLVRSVKTALTAVLTEKTPKEEVLQTVLVEAEYSINARPLTHVSVDPNDPEAITPNHFLLGTSTGLPHTGPCQPADRKVWRASQALADEFWRRWIREYLPTLVPRQAAAADDRQLRKGDLVVVVDATLPRNTWPRGVVEEIYPGPDGRVRIADVRTRGGVFRRPTSKLAVLTVGEASTVSAPGGELLSTDSAIMALRRMGARRGWPQVMYSDNATNFRGADKELREAVTEWEPSLRDYALTQRIEWLYISPGAPHQGGAWERMIRSVKSALRVTLNEKAPRDEVLHTLLVEVEHTMNARPLTHVPVSADDPEALTPNHFLVGGSHGLPITGPCETATKKTWRVAQALADEYWRRWLKEYLPELIPRRGARDVNEAAIKPGDLVIVADHTLPRNVWPRGVVTQVHPGPDGGVRNVEVRTKGGVFRRPASRLAVLPME
ncbi:hypothetical protein ABMA28_010152 [Loxostege sticticalis]|uniref:Integrase catalytic domain-containing protein n=1 Tax=Loxostege sticticalis TaxID=481309 RepID=A0ABD0SAF6_LOXSC